jgi:carbamate kinase
MSDLRLPSDYQGPPSTSGERSARNRPIALVAVGGHAFMEKGERGTVEEHERNAAGLCEKLMTLVDRGYELVVTHGNGPQVGNLLLQQEAAQEEVPPMPLDVLVAQTEGSLGYILQQALLNQLRSRNIRRYVVTVVTQVLVEESDEAFSSPSKPIGPFLSEGEARRRAKDLGWTVKEDAGRGWRRLVPSPIPVKVIQRHMIRDAARQGHIVLACGGGGIPITEDPATRAYKGVEAVIDKDLTSAVLASQIGADLFIILTAVPQVYVGFNTPDQRALGAVTLQEIEALRDAGHFPAGSMGPKIDAIIQFLRGGGIRGLVTNPDRLADALEGRAGTHFVGRI